MPGMSPTPKRKALLSSLYLQGVILQFNKTFSTKTVYFEIDNINNSNNKNIIYFIKLKNAENKRYTKIRVEKAIKWVERYHSVNWSNTVRQHFTLRKEDRRHTAAPATPGSDSRLA